MANISTGFIGIALIPLNARMSNKNIAAFSDDGPCCSAVTGPECIVGFLCLCK